jgi:hypothetical protein
LLAAVTVHVHSDECKYLSAASDVSLSPPMPLNAPLGSPGWGFFFEV